MSIDDPEVGGRQPPARLLGPHLLSLDPAARRAFVGPRQFHLTRQSFDLLAYLLESQGRVVPTDELITAVWGHSVVVDRHFVQTAIYRLREALRSAGVHDLIEAVRGVGFRIDPIPSPPSPVDASGVAASALRASALPSLIIDQQQRILFANDAAARLTGYSIEELEALPSAEVLSPPAVRERRREDLQHVMTGAADEGWSEPVLRRDGSVVHLELLAQPIAIEAGATAVLIQLWVKHGQTSEIEPLWRSAPAQLPMDGSSDDDN